ncbi:RteC domain-containing protein [Nonlabens sp. Asnod3-H03]|uniref:RteC domain-containing protein n=1 Tax=Nonlabens sp. Asnod3-H03 TaxID=3160580 RepID=UPI0038673776
MKFDLIKEFTAYKKKLGALDFLIGFSENYQHELDEIKKYNNDYFKYCEEVLSDRIYHENNIEPLYFKELGRILLEIKKYLIQIEKVLIEKHVDLFKIDHKEIDRLRLAILSNRLSFESFYNWSKIRIEDVLGYDLENTNPEKNLKDFNSTLKWKGTQTDLVELVKSLIESKSIEGTQTETLDMFCKILNFKVNNPDQKIQEIKTRKDRKPIFLERLKTSLLESF